MPFNRREEILQRILEVLKTVTGLATVDGQPAVFRNRGAVDYPDRPAIVMLDGRQEKRTETRGKSRMPPVEMVLQPQIFVLLPLAATNENNSIGETLSDFEVRVLAALFADGQLWELLGGDSGQIEYTSLDTDMQTGSSMEGQEQLGIAFTYIFDPNEL